MFVDIRIAAALLNAFKEPLKDHPRANDIIQVLNERMHMANSLGDYVIENNINRQRASFRTITADDNQLLQFPVLTEEDLLLISLGSYQIKLARSYLSEHLRNGMYTIEICIGAIPNLVRYNINISEGILLRGRIKSRHVSGRIYYSYILIKNRAETGRDAIAHYYCSCLTGKRTVGTCAHIMSIIWYLGWARHQPSILLPATFLDDIIIDNNYY